MDVLKAPELQRLRNEHHARAVQRGVDYLEVLLAADGFRVDGDAVDEVEVDLVYLLADDLYQALVAVELDVFHLHLVHLVDDARVVGGQHLRAVSPVGLVAIVLLGVVACGDVDAALASEMAYGERAFRRGAHVVEEVHLYAVGREDVGHGLGE